MHTLESNIDMLAERLMEADTAALQQAELSGMHSTDTCLFVFNHRGLYSTLTVVQP